MSQITKLLIVVFSAALLIGCETLGGKGEEAPEGQPGVGAPGEGAQARGVGEGYVFSADALDDPSSPLARRVVYFEFDSSSIDAEGRGIIEVHAAYLTQYPGTSLVLEGHADERGTREYNIGLGERRAHAVRQLLVLQGVQESQVQIVSYGEERPAAQGHDESAWQLNRRVEIIYQQ